MKGLNRQIVRAASTASSSVDLYPNHTTFLAHFDGAQADTSGVGFQDYSWNRWTPSQAVSETQNAALTATTYFQGGTSLDMSYTTNYNVATRYSAVNWAVPTGTTATIAGTVCDMSRDWTIEGWIYWVSLPASGSQAYFVSTDSPNNFTYSATVNGVRPGCRDNGELFYYMDNGTDYGGPAQGTAGSVKFTTGQWQHFAIVHQNNFLGVFLNGVAATGSWIANPGARTHSQGFGYVRVGVDCQKSGSPYYIDEVRITSGVARYSTATNFTVDASSRFPLPKDPYRANVTTHLRCENAVLDVSQRQVAWSVNGTMAYNTGGSQAFNSYCMSPRQGSSQSTYAYVTTSGDTGLFSPGTGDFTIECWAYRTTTNNGQGIIFDNRPYLTSSTTPSTGAAGLQFWFDGTNLAHYADGGSVPKDTLVGYGAHGMSSTTWYHIALSRNSGTCKMYINGVQKASYSDTNNYGFNTTSGAYAGTQGVANTYARIGEGNNASNNNNGANFDEVRITVGVGRYPAAFTPPTAPFPGE